MFSVPKLEKLLKTSEPEALKELYTQADEVRKKYMGDEILIRGIVEFSNRCRNSCAYCGLNKHNKSLERFCLTSEQLLQSIQRLADAKIKTVVLQSGEDDALDVEWLSRMIIAIKQKYDMAITLSVGERAKADYKLWREAGADRYLLKIETSNKKIYEKLHEGMSFENRIACLRDLKDLGYQTGSGIIIGLRGQTVESLAQDILFFKQWDFDMIGIGPFIPHKQTILGAEHSGDALMTLKVLALTRIITKNAHLPATTSLGSLGESYRTQALQAGANVVMPNFTPDEYRSLYEIYPGKIYTALTQLEEVAETIGRTVNYSKGDSVKKILS